MTQSQRVIEYIRRQGSITRAEALNDLGIANLTAVIAHIRHTIGLDVITLMMDAENRYGEPCRYARYTILAKELKAYDERKKK